LRSIFLTWTSATPNKNHRKNKESARENERQLSCHTIDLRGALVDGFGVLESGGLTGLDGRGNGVHNEGEMGWEITDTRNGGWGGRGSGGVCGRGREMR
jgi:hypothetical protein